MSNRKTLPPVVEKRDDGSMVETHPSYGLVHVGHYTTTPPQNFFGSSVRHSAGVSLTISLAQKSRDLSNTWYSSRDEVIKIDMTGAQWTELLALFNHGSGVPCTISHVNKSALEDYEDTLVPPCPETNERQEIESEFRRAMADTASGVSKLIERAQELQSKPSITKADRKEFLDIANNIKCKIDCVLPFIHAQFNEAMDGIVVNAKHDLELFANQLIRQAGLDAVKDKILALSTDSANHLEDQKPTITPE